MASGPIHLNVSVNCVGVAAWRLRWLAVFARFLSIPVTTCGRLDGRPMHVGADGLIHGEPLDLTDAQRAALPPLVPLDPGAPIEYATGYGSAA